MACYREYQFLATAYTIFKPGNALKKNCLLFFLFTFTIRVLFCQQPDSSWNKFEIITQPQENFTVYKIRPQIFLIRETSCFEDINCYLFIGKEKCLLFDSGLGIGNIKKLVDNLTHLPVVVLNSHTHYDHINGNYLFSNVAGLNNAYSKINAKGMEHEAFLSFYKQAYLAGDSVVQCIPPAYFIHPFLTNQFVKDKDEIALGGMTLVVLKTPGHTPDGICLFDKENGMLFSGDLIYKGTLFIHLPGSNFTDFSNSITKLNTMKPQIKNIMPAHGAVDLDTYCITRMVENIGEIKSGKANFTNVNGIHFFDFSYFKFLVK